jgi:hypothetical protein
MVAITFGMAGCKSCCSSGSCPSGSSPSDSTAAKTTPQAKALANNNNYYPQQNMAGTPGTPAQASWNTQRMPGQAMQPDAVAPASRYGVSQPMMVQQQPVMPQQPMYTQNPGAQIRQIPADPNMGNGYAAPGYSGGAQPANNVYRPAPTNVPMSNGAPMGDAQPMDNGAASRPQGDVYQAQNPGTQEPMAPAASSPEIPMGR